MLEFGTTGGFFTDEHSLETPSQPAVDDSSVREQLGRLLASPHFRTSKRCQSLLRYVVEAYLGNHTDRVKERTIGIEVFQRDPDYDTNQDSVVRTTAAEIRKKLAQYYLDPGHESEVRVLLPQGSYLPEFRAAAPVAVAPVPAPTDEVVPVAAPVGVLRQRLIGMALGLGLAVGAALIFYGVSRPHTTELTLFWKPLLEDNSSAVICVGQPLRVYIFDGHRTADLNEKMVGTLTTPPATPEIRQRTQISLSELRAAGDRYYSVGDYLASVRLAEFLGQRAKPFQVIGDRSAAFKDLRGRPAVLIGQFNNLWTMGLTGSLRYYIDRSTERFSYDVLDRQNPGKVVFSAARNVYRPEEYAIVSRIFDAPTEKTVVSIAGMTFNGTIAAGEFLTGERYMRETFGHGPAGWHQKNIQVILKTMMVGGATGPPKVVATYYW